MGKYWIGHAAHIKLEFKTVLTIEVASAISLVFWRSLRPIKIVVMEYTSFFIVADKINDDDDEIYDWYRDLCHWYQH